MIFFKVCNVVSHQLHVLYTISVCTVIVLFFTCHAFIAALLVLVEIVNHFWKMEALEEAYGLHPLQTFNTFLYISPFLSHASH